MQDDSRFIEPPWDEPLDAEAALAAVPEGATISGMFPSMCVDTARALGLSLVSARTSYASFKFYPLVEHARLLLETARALHPDLPLRRALRKIGRYAPQALMRSMLGKVMLGTTQGVHSALEGMAKAYALNLRPGSVHVLSMGETHARLALEDIGYFLDSHHIGSFEGVLAFAGVKGHVRLWRQDETNALFLVEWAS